MTYKNELLHLIRHYLLTKHTSAEVEKLIGRWNDSSFKDTRNENIEQAIKEIKQLIDTQE